MKLLVTVDGKQGELRYERDGDALRFLYRREDGAEISREATIVECEPGIFSILVDGRSYDARVVTAPSGYYVDLRGLRSTVEVRDPRSLAPRNGSGSVEGRKNVTASMPGKIVRVLVSEGDEVEAGAGLVVVEAMKMQNEMKAPKSGRVVLLTAREGQTVGAGEILAAIE